MHWAYKKIYDTWLLGASRREATQEDYLKILHAFVRFQGHLFPHQIKRKDILAFRTFLIESGQHPTTANRKVGVLKTLFRNAVEYELLEENPAGNIRQLSPPTRKPRLAFSLNELQHIFNSPLYTSGFIPRGAGREAAFWLPLLALFSGARLEELCQLTVGDIRHAEGLGHYFNITDESGHNKLKNAASRRRIPVHRTLIDCGLLEYAESMRSRQRLFPELKANPRGKLGGYFSDFFSRYLRKRIGILDRRKVFHSFRHTFKETCRQLGIEEAVHDALTGHTNANIGRKYGNEHYPLPPLFAAMERFHVEGLDLRHLVGDVHCNIETGNATTNDSASQIISAYYGITVTLDHSSGTPSVHAQHDGKQTWIRISDNRILSNGLPFAKYVLVQAWIEIHRAELLAAWSLSRNGSPCFGIAPLH